MEQVSVKCKLSPDESKKKLKKLVEIEAVGRMGLIKMGACRSWRCCCHVFIWWTRIVLNACGETRRKWNRYSPRKLMVSRERLAVYERLMQDAPYEPWQQFMQQIFDKHAQIEINEIADLGCGTGYVTRQLAKAGYHMTGIDQSENMLALCCFPWYESASALDYSRICGSCESIKADACNQYVWCGQYILRHRKMYSKLSPDMARCLLLAVFSCSMSA